MNRLLSLSLLLLAQPALAEIPKVATDIAPVHGLAARVMQGLGTPDLIVPPSASPHDFALRPSQARALQEADLVIWIGPDLAPWMERTLDNLAGASSLELNALPETHLLGWRDAEMFDGDEHDDHDHDHGHDHGATDPHSWLDPENAKHWTDAIAATLAEQDPENSAIYLENAEAAKSDIDAAAARAEARLGPHKRKPYLVFHDAYHYFEAHFDLHAAGSVADGDAAAPGPGRIRALQARIAAEGIACLFTEPQFETGLVETLADGTDAGIGVLDPMGAGVEAGPGFYPALLLALADAMAACFEG